MIDLEVQRPLLTLLGLCLAVVAVLEASLVIGLVTALLIVLGIGPPFVVTRWRPGR